MQEMQVPSLARQDPMEDEVTTHGKCHGQRSLVDCSPWSRKELDMTEGLSMRLLKA